MKFKFYDYFFTIRSDTFHITQFKLHKLDNYNRSLA